MVAKLFDYLHNSLERETEVGEMEVYIATQYVPRHNYVFIQVEGIMNEFQTNWSTFDRIHSDIYLNQLKVTFFLANILAKP